MLRGTKGISTLSLIILVLVSGTVGAVLSYLWTVGYYVDIGLKVPEGTTIAITGATFPVEDSAYFDVTLLNPTTSKTDAFITSIAMITTANDVITIADIEPSTPYPLKRGETITFKCNENWGEYAGQIVKVAVFVENASGATQSYLTEFVKLEITELSYNTTITINQFNITVRNRSEIPLDVSKIRLGILNIPPEAISVDTQNITFPYRIPENESRLFTCDFPLWNSETNSGHLGTASNIFIETLQGYFANYTRTFPKPVILTVSNVTFPQSNVTQFVLGNDPESPHYVDLSNVTITVGNETLTVNTNITGYRLEKGVNITVLCDGFNWEDWSSQTITIRVYTTQGFQAKKEETIPSG